ncbi:MAG: anti-sigma factor [Caldilineaceae bacterium]|nr:anti-sigma factor [Caldilineaceae bacterium]
MNPETSSNDLSQLPVQPQRCEEIAPLIAAHAIGATDPEEVARINALLADCPQTAAELAAYSQVATRLMYSAAPAKAPRQIADHLRAAITSSAPTTAPATPTRPAFLRRRVGARRHNGGNQHVTPLSPAMAAYYLSPARETPQKSLPLVNHKTTVAPQPSRWHFGRILATAAAVTLIVTNVAVILQNQQLVQQQAFLTQSLAEQNRALILLAAEEPQEVEILDPSGASTAKADILWNKNLGIAIVYVRNFPQCEAGMKYQLWLTKDGQRSSGGLFSVDANGMGLLVVTLDHALDAYDAIGITPEPASGSPGPTSPPVVRGEL